jgi:hypothetical protein
MMKLSTKWLFGAGFALIVATNAVVLAGVAYNRSGEPESRLQLTERELVPLHGVRPATETSGLDLDLSWRVLARTPALDWAGSRGSAAWLDEAKLTSLGFDLTASRDTPAGRRHYQRLLPREVLIVLELDGPAYQESLERARRRAEAEAKRNAEKPPDSPVAPRANAAAVQLEREQNRLSRLFAVDAGLDASALREKYPDRGRYAIVRGKAAIDRYRYEGGPIHGFVSAIDNTRINVPVEFHAAIREAVLRDRSVPANTVGIEADVAFGRRFEPWIIAASPRESAPAGK